MVRYIKHIALFLSLALIAGCNPGITDNPPAVIENVQDYFWNSASNNSLFYEYFQVSDSSRKEYEYSFQHLAGTGGTMTVSELPQPNSHGFYYKFDSTGSVLVGGLSYRTLFPLPDGYELAPNAILHDTLDTSIGTRKVLAIGDGKVVAIGDDESVYYSTSNGASWTKSVFEKTYGVISTWTKIVVDKQYVVYAGTSTGFLVKSVDGGITWGMVKYFSNTNIVSVAALSAGHIFIASGTKTIIDYDVNKDTIKKYDGLYPVTSVAVCEEGSDSGGVVYPTMITGTDGGGLSVWEYGISQSFRYSTNGQKAYTTLKVVSTGKKSALALAKSKSGETMLLFTMDGGSSWLGTSVPIFNYQFLDAIVSSDNPVGVLCDVNGKVTLASGLQPVIQQTRTAISGRIIRDISIANGIIVAAVDSFGVIYSTDSGITWTISSKGLSRTVISTRKSEGLLTLLPTFSDGLNKGDEWIAGYISQSNVSSSNTIEMYAKVLEHYSRLDLPFSAGLYSDVYEVSYTCAPNDRGVNTVHVFYAKEYGPILFQRYVGNDLIDESYLVKK
jgi:hypothetical protein